MVDLWYAEYYGYGMRPVTPGKALECEWYRPNKLTIVRPENEEGMPSPGGGGWLYQYANPNELETCVEWAVNCHPTYRDNIRLVHAETDEVLPGVLFV